MFEVKKRKEKKEEKALATLSHHFMFEAKKKKEEEQKHFTRRLYHFTSTVTKFYRLITVTNLFTDGARNTSANFGGILAALR